MKNGNLFRHEKVVNIYSLSGWMNGRTLCFVLLQSSQILDTRTRTYIYLLTQTITYLAQYGVIVQPCIHALPNQTKTNTSKASPNKLCLMEAIGGVGGFLCAIQPIHVPVVRGTTMKVTHTFYIHMDQMKAEDRMLRYSVKMGDGFAALGHSYYVQLFSSLKKGQVHLCAYVRMHVASNE